MFWIGLAQIWIKIKSNLVQLLVSSSYICWWSSPASLLIVNIKKFQLLLLTAEQTSLMSGESSKLLYSESKLHQSLLSKYCLMILFSLTSYSVCFVLVEPLVFYRYMLHGWLLDELYIVWSILGIYERGSHNKLGSMASLECDMKVHVNTNLKDLRCKTLEERLF